MKIKFESEQKKYTKVSELPAVKNLILEMKSESFKYEAEIAARIATGENLNEILKIEAEISHNNRIYNRYADNSGTLDIWFKIYAFNSYSRFYVIGSYLSDLWESTENNENELRKHMYIRKFTEISE